jgi:uncharacterized protein with NRDE domain
MRSDKLSALRSLYEDNMCLILFAIQPGELIPTGSTYRLVVAANRDEFYARPSRTASFWPEDDNILGGQDLSMGGTWLGITRTGRFAAVTNYRETPPHPVPPRSRGDLTAGFLSTDVPAKQYLQDIRSRGDQYRGFNLLLGDAEGFYYLSNRQADVIKLEPGFYGLSNQLLNCDWPKVVTGRHNLRSLIEQQDASVASLLNLLSGQGDGSAFSNSFIESTEYGTCAQTVVLWQADGNVTFAEQCFQPNGVTFEPAQYQFQVS